MIPVKLAVCVPSGDSVAAEFTSDLVSLVAYQTARQAPGSSLQVFFSKGAQPAVQRCDLVRLALQANADWILWVNPDMRFPRGALERLLSLEVPIAAANYVATVAPYLPAAVKALDPELRLRTEPTSSGLEYVQATGMGLMLTSTEVFRKLPEPWFMVGFHAETRSYFGEELYFCRRAVEAGFRIVIDHDLSKLAARVGSFEYRHELVTRTRAAERPVRQAATEGAARAPASTVSDE